MDVTTATTPAQPSNMPTKHRSRLPVVVGIVLLLVLQAVATRYFLRQEWVKRLPPELNQPCVPTPPLTDCGLGTVVIQPVLPWQIVNPAWYALMIVCLIMQYVLWKKLKPGHSALPAVFSVLMFALGIIGAYVLWMIF